MQQTDVETARMTRWGWLRNETPALREHVYLNCGWAGPLSNPVAQAVKDYLDLELSGGPTTRHVLDERMAAGNRFRETTAQMLGADVDEITITGNTTEGINIVTNGVRLEPGDEVLTTSIEHASGMVPAYYLRERRGADVRIVSLSAADSRGVAVERFASAFSERTRLVLISEISYSTGQLLPLDEIVELAHSHGAAVVVDGAQTAGHVPIDVRASNVDYYAVPSHKWLCGPSGLGALYVRRDRIRDLEPAKVAHAAAASYDHDGGFVPERDKVTKFELTTVSSALLAGAAAATQQYLDSGAQAVWDRVRELNRYAEQRFSHIAGVEVRSPRTEDTRTGLFTFAVAGEEPVRVSAYLQLYHRVVCRYVAETGAVRLSLHVYNTEEDIEQAAQGVEQAVREGVPATLEAVTPWERIAAEQT